MSWLLYTRGVFHQKKKHDMSMISFDLRKVISHGLDNLGMLTVKVGPR